MNKAEMIKALCTKNTYHKVQAELALDGVLEVIKETLAKGEDINLAGFGSFTVADSPERQGRNPKTGEPLTIAARKTPKFKPGKALKDLVNS